MGRRIHTHARRKGAGKAGHSGIHTPPTAPKCWTSSQAATQSWFTGCADEQVLPGSAGRASLLPLGIGGGLTSWDCRPSRQAGESTHVTHLLLRGLSL